MSIYERGERRTRKGKKDYENAQRLTESARQALARTGFPALIDIFKQNNPHALVTRLAWDAKGRSGTAVEVAGLPNSVGIVIEWDRDQTIDEVDTVGTGYQIQTSFRAVIIRANPYGGVSIEGSGIIGRQCEYWEQNPRKQREALKAAFQKPKLIVFNKHFD